MTQVSVAPQPLPGSVPAQAVAAPGATDPAAADGSADFAAVLKAQIAQPAKDAPGGDILAALQPSGTAESAEEAPPAEALPAAPDLAALLPALSPALPPSIAAAMLQTVKEPAVAPEQPATAPAGDLSTLAASRNTVALMADASPADTGTPVETASASLQPAHPSANATMQMRQAEPVAASADPALPAAGAEHANPTAAAHAAAPLAHAAAAGGAAPVVRVDTPVGARGWDAEVGQKIVLLANNRESRAELTLTPPQLGRVDVSISMSGDQTSATFVSASPAAREALEQALPRLREILAEAGITLGQASVNAESAPRDGNGTPGEPRGNDGRGRNAGTANAAAPWLRRSEGLIDTFA